MGFPTMTDQYGIMEYRLVDGAWVDCEIVYQTNHLDLRGEWLWYYSQFEGKADRHYILVERDYGGRACPVQNYPAGWSFYD